MGCFLLLYNLKKKAFLIVIDADKDNKDDQEMKPGTNASSNASSAAPSRTNSRKKFFSRMKMKVKKTNSDPVATKNRYFVF